jgi:hypothetical protein
MLKKAATPPSESTAAFFGKESQAIRTGCRLIPGIFTP